MIIPAAVRATLSLLRKYLPVRKVGTPAQHDSNLVDEDFSKTQWMIVISLIVFGFAFAFIVHTLLVAANRHFADADGPFAFRFLPSAVIWWFFPGFGALSLSWEITLFLWSIFEDQGKIARYVAWTDEQTGFDSTRALRWMALTIAMPIGIATILAIPLHSTLRENDIVVGHYATLARQHLPYSQAHRLVLVDGFRNRSGKFAPRAGMIVDFADGSRWRSSDNGDFKSEVDPELVAFLQRKTGLSVEHVETEADVAEQTQRR
jgi:hypothetical protein